MNTISMVHGEQPQYATDLAALSIAITKIKERAWIFKTKLPLSQVAHQG